MSFYVRKPHLIYEPIENISVAHYPMQKKYIMFKR